MVDKVDSNIVSTRYALEQTIGVLPGSPVWNPLEPNTFGDYGPEYQTVQRSPITASRQKKKGALTDVEAGVSLESDWLQLAMYDLMPSFFFAAWRAKTKLNPTSVTSTDYVVPSGGTGFLVNSLLFAKGFTNAGNNGLKLVTASTGTTVAAAGLVAEGSPPAGASIKRVGQQGASGDITVTVSGGVATIGATALNLTTLGIIPGEWFFVGGDLTAEKFATAASNGWYRAKTIAAGAIVTDRKPDGAVTDNGSGKTIRLFLADVIKNESDPLLIVRSTVQFERNFQNSLPVEYMLGQVANELSLDIKAGEKVVATLSFLGLRAEYVTEKTGSRPALITEPPFTASNDFSRIRLQREDTGVSLATYMETLKLSIKNNCKYNKAIGVLGAFEITAGDFEASGEAEAYFASFEAATAIQTNVDVSLDFVMAALNAGWLFDLPLVTLGNARPDVKKDEAVKLPLTAMGSAHNVLNHTLLAQSFTYLPTLAM